VKWWRCEEIRLRNAHPKFWLIIHTPHCFCLFVLIFWWSGYCLVFDGLLKHPTPSFPEVNKFDPFTVELWLVTQLSLVYCYVMQRKVLKIEICLVDKLNFDTQRPNYSMIKLKSLKQRIKNLMPTTLGRNRFSDIYNCALESNFHENRVRWARTS
jgi:hypothetical protein